MVLPVLLASLLACSRDAGPPGGPAAGASPAERPDVVLVVIDTLRGDHVGYAGHDRPTTPALDAWAADHAWFARAFSTSSWTLPATTSMLTGRSPHDHGAAHRANRYGRVREEVPTLAERFKARGYRTAAFVNNAFLAPDFHLQRGFDVYDYEGAGLVDHRTFEQTVRAALAWLEGGEGPAFLLVHAMEPHADYQPSPANRGRFSSDLPHTLRAPLGGPRLTRLIQGQLVPEPPDRAWIEALYDEEIRSVDDALGPFLEALARRPGAERMRVAVTSDHGEEFWDYGQYEHGHNLLSPTLHVPLAIGAPGLPAGRVDAPVTTQDLFRFLLDGGGPLVEAARGGRPHEVLFAEDVLYDVPHAAAFDEDVKVVVRLGTPRVRAWRLADGLREADEIPDPGADPRVRALLDRLREARGDLDPVSIEGSVAIPSYDAFQQLRALGYVE